MPGSSTPPARSWREQFGESGTPDISRKITACVACRRMKIKCAMRDAQPPCTRCKKRGLSCTVNRSLQTILESDVTWKHEIGRKIQSLEAGLTRVANHLSLAGVIDDMSEHESQDESPTVHPSEIPSKQASNLEGSDPENFEIVVDPESGPAAIPGSIFSPGAIAQLDKRRQDQDIVTRGFIDASQAEAFLNIYQNRLDHFLYRILGDRRDLNSIRKASPLLLAAICAVGALHLADAQFERCYHEFVSIAAGEMFTRRNTIDDVRGLCIGAFWLSGISWTCIGAAVRISTEIKLHRSIFKALDGDRTHYLRTRLYYLVYVCDHHFSIPYGRPPMTRDDESIRVASHFLKTENAVQDDVRLVSQVEMWSVASEIYNTFGIDVERPLDVASIEPLRRFAIRLDGIRAHWAEAFTHNRYVGNYPRKGLGLHIHFLKLYLHSMAFRGSARPQFKSSEVALDVDELANAAFLSATAILRTVVSDTEIQSYLNGLPTYFDLMIAFAVVFVLEVATKFANSVRVDTGEVRALVSELAQVLKVVTATMHPRHMLVSVAKGTQKLLDKCDVQFTESSTISVTANLVPNQIEFGGLYNTATTWNSNAPFDDFFMGEFDFLSTQDAMSFPFDLQYQGT